MSCKICRSITEFFGEATLMGKHRAEYDRCTSCGFVSARQPYWLKEAYSSAITSTDLGTVSRTDQNSLKTKAVIDLFFNTARCFLDYGAGYGMFVRRMRDLGYNFHAYDLYCQNLFSAQFNLTDLTGKQFDLITAFEVFEHLEDPNTTFDTLLKCSDNLLFTTELLPVPNPRPTDWWYFGLDHGQHISLYTRLALERVAATHNRHLCSNGVNLHLLSRKPVREYWFRKVTEERNAQWLGLWRRRPTLLVEDWQNLRKEVSSKLS